AWAATATPFSREIRVPYPPESSASGIGETGFHPVVWYRRAITRDELARSGAPHPGARTFVHFGAVDYRATVWIDGVHVGGHDGGQTPFTLDITTRLVGVDHDPVLVVRAEDDPHDVEQPRGKQDWLEDPHVIWYHR